MADGTWRKQTNGSMGCENSQVVGSNVIVFTTGTAPMTFTLTFITTSDDVAGSKFFTVNGNVAYEMCAPCD